MVSRGLGLHCFVRHLLTVCLWGGSLTTVTLWFLICEMEILRVPPGVHVDALWEEVQGARCRPDAWGVLGQCQLFWVCLVSPLPSL